MDEKKRTTMSVPEMRRMLGLGITQGQILLHVIARYADKVYKTHREEGKHHGKKCYSVGFHIRKFSVILSC